MHGSPCILSNSLCTAHELPTSAPEMEAEIRMLNPFLSHPSPDTGLVMSHQSHGRELVMFHQSSGRKLVTL